MTKEEIRLKAVDNAKKYEVWPPAADYQDGLIKGFEDGAEWMLDNPTGGALLYAVEKTAERTKREMIEKAVQFIHDTIYNWAGSDFRDAKKTWEQLRDEYIKRFKQAMQDESRRLD